MQAIPLLLTLLGTSLFVTAARAQAAVGEGGLQPKLLQIAK